MRARGTKWISILLCTALLLGLAACQITPAAPVNIDALFATVLQQVDFATELSDTGEDSALYYPELPQGAAITLYAGSGYCHLG